MAGKCLLPPFTIHATDITVFQTSFCDKNRVICDRTPAYRRNVTALKCCSEMKNDLTLVDVFLLKMSKPLATFFFLLFTRDLISSVLTFGDPLYSME